MSFKEKISKLVSVSEGDYYDDADDVELEYDDEEDYDEPQDVPVAKKSAFGGFRSQEKQRSNVVNFDQPQQQQRVKPKIVVSKPATFGESKEIADHINAKCLVFLNLEATSSDIARRLVDFLGGVVYANNGTIQKVSNGTFAIVPNGYDFSGDKMDSIENGVYFG